MATDEVAVLVDGLEPAVFQARPLVVVEEFEVNAADRRPGAGPVDEPDAELEGAGPVGAEGVWALPLPGVQLSRQSFQVAPLVCRYIRLC